MLPFVVLCGTLGAPSNTGVCMFPFIDKVFVRLKNTNDHDLNYGVHRFRPGEVKEIAHDSINGKEHLYESLFMEIVRKNGR